MVNMPQNCGPVRARRELQSALEEAEGFVRAYLGNERLDTVAQTLALNQPYYKMWLHFNFFQPVMRLAEKERIQEEGQPTRLKRRYDKARTPFDGLCHLRP